MCRLRKFPGDVRLIQFICCGKIVDTYVTIRVHTNKKKKQLKIMSKSI